MVEDKIIMNKKTTMLFLQAFCAFIFSNALWCSQSSKKNTILSSFPKTTPSSFRKNLNNSTDSASKKDLSSELSTLPMPPVEKKFENTSNKKEESNIANDTKSSEEKNDAPKAAQPLTKVEKELFENAKKEEEKEQKFSFYLKEASFENVVTYIENLLKVKFLPDDAVKPLIANGGTLQGQKVTFKTNKPLTRTEVWDLFIKFLDLANLAIVPGTIDNLYLITSVTNANQDPVPCYFGTDITDLPNNPTKIRYIYFVKNLPLATLQTISTSLASTTAKINTFDDLGALIITDKSSNIRSLMVIVQELDKELPEAMSILKLQQVEAATVKKLYDDLTSLESPGGNKFAGQRRQPQAPYFPLDARIIVEPRTNSLILLGPKKALQKIEDFIAKHIDVTLDIPYSPLHVYDLQYTDATNMASILTTVTKFGASTTAGQYGGTIGGEQFFKSISITPETAGNKLVIKAEDSDYAKLKKIIEQLDIMQPQVAIECLIVSVDVQKNKELSTQFRNKNDGSVVNNVNFQTSGLGTIQTATDPTNSANSTLLGNLMSLVAGTGTSATVGAGSTLFTLTSPINGVWGILKMLQTFAQTNIVNTPFLVTTNKTAATFSAGSTRRIVTATVGGQNSTEALPASLTVAITPTISPDGKISMAINIALTEFTDTSSGNTSTKSIVTSATIGDGEIIALGGLTQYNVSHTLSKFFPILSDLPIIGNLFRSKTSQRIRKNIFFFIAPKLIHSAHNETMNDYTKKHIASTKKSIEGAQQERGSRDPIDKVFFGADAFNYLDNLDNFITPDEEKPARRKRLREEKNKMGKRIAQEKPERSSSKKNRLSRKGVSA